MADKRKILLVDDEEDFLKITKMNLEQTDRFEVLTLSSSKDIITHLHNFKPHVIILDLLMPAIGGIEVCDLLNKDSVGQGVPVIILSALGKDTDKLNAYKKGVIDYLTKPIETDELIAKIDRALQTKYTDELNTSF